jgi:DNA-binding NarL/FixJ family response regulator
MAAMILIVEDDSFKSDDIRSLIKETSPSALVHRAADVASAITTLRSAEFDLIVIDMALPSHPVVTGGGSPMSLLTGGLEILFELESLGRADRCVVITQYPEIEICGDFYPVAQAAAAIKERYGYVGEACLEYSENTPHWRGTLERLLVHANPNS